MKEGYTSKSLYNASTGRKTQASYKNGVKYTGVQVVCPSLA